MQLPFNPVWVIGCKIVCHETNLFINCSFKTLINVPIEKIGTTLHLKSLFQRKKIRVGFHLKKNDYLKNFNK